MDRGLHVRLLQTGETSFQGAHEALPQVVHGADELVGHGLVQSNYDQLLDLMDARFDLLRRDRLAVGRHDDVCSQFCQTNS